MRTDELEIVCFALALHLEIDPMSISEDMQLDEELGLDPLDLVLVVLRLEELGDAEFPIAALEGIRTVGDLVSVVRSWEQGPATLLPRQTCTLPAPPVPERRARTKSGIIAVNASELAAPRRTFVG